MDISEFPNQKRAIFRKIKELRGGVPWYVEPEIPQIDTEIAEKGRLRREPIRAMATIGRQWFEIHTR